MGKINKIFITGATGYLGKYLLRQLLDEGHTLYVAVRNNSNLKYINTLKGSLNIVNIEVTNLEAIFADNHFDIVVHTAACYGRKGESLMKIVQSNLYFPLEILDLAVKYQVGTFINTDTSLPKTLNAYSHSKKQFLEWLDLYSKQIRVINMQLEYFYGPGDDNTKFITSIIRSMLANEKDLDFTEATPLRDFIYIKDIVSAYLIVMANIDEISSFTTIPVGSGIARSLKEIITQVRELVGAKKVQLNFGVLPMRPNEIMYSCADTSILNGFGWKLRYDFVQGILETIDIEKNSL